VSRPGASTAGMARVSTEGTHRGRYMLATITVVIALVAISQLALLALDINPARTQFGWHENLWGTDAYARLLRVEQLNESGGWYDPVLRRFNAPYGLAMHWTRPMDALLYIGGAIGSLGAGFHDALHFWALVLPPMLAVVSLLVLYWGTRPFLSGTGFLCAALLFVLQQGTTYEFAIGNADHHALLLTVMVVSFAAMLRYLHDTAPAVLAVCAVAGGGAVWITPEGLLVVIPSMATLGLLWMTGRGTTRSIFRYCLYFCITVWVALVIERAATLTAVEFDRLSLVHALLATGLLAGAALLHAASRRIVCAMAWQRALTGACVAGAALLPVVWMFPGLAQHPFDHVDPYVRRTLLDWISMERSLWPRDTSSTFEFLLLVLPGIVATIYCTVVLITGPDSKRPRHLLYLAGLIIYIPYAISTARGIMLLHTWVVMPWAEMLLALVRGTLRVYRRDSRVNVMLAAAVGCVVFAGHWGIAFGFAAAASARVNFKLVPACDFGEIAPYLRDERVVSDQAVLTSLTDAPEIAYRTQFAVVNAPYHRNATGIRDGFEAMFGPSEEKAKDIFTRRHITHILWCRNVPGMWKSVFRSAPNALLTRLFTFRAPDWLRPVPLPRELSQRFVFYRVADQR